MTTDHFITQQGPQSQELLQQQSTQQHSFHPHHHNHQSSRYSHGKHHNNNSPDIVVDSSEDMFSNQPPPSGLSKIFPPLPFIMNGIVGIDSSNGQNQNLNSVGNDSSSGYEATVSSSTTSHQDCQVTSSSSTNSNSSIENIVADIQAHPLYPLLIRLLQNCEIATSKADSIPGNNDTFLTELKQFIQMKITNNKTLENMSSDQKVEYLNNPEYPKISGINNNNNNITKKSDDACMNGGGGSNETIISTAPTTSSSTNGKKKLKGPSLGNKKVSNENDSFNPMLRGLNIEDSCSSDEEEEALEDSLASAKFEILSRNTELDELMIRAIQVLRIHMLELQKVNELCKDFCIRYTQSLKAKFQNETSLLDSQPSSPSESEATSPNHHHLPFNNQNPFNHTNGAYDNNSLDYMGPEHCDKRRASGNPDSRSSTASNGSNSSANILNHLSLSAHTAAALNESLDQLDTFNFSSGLSGSGSRQKRGVLPKKATQIMKQWLFQHLVHPYPTEDEKRHIATQTNLTLLQVNNWFINARRRILQPMLDSTNHVTLLDGWSDEKEHPTIVNKKKKAATNRPSNNRFWPASLAAAAAIHPVAAGLIPVSSGGGGTKPETSTSTGTNKVKNEEDSTCETDETSKKASRKRSRKSEYSNNLPGIQQQQNPLNGQVIDENDDTNSRKSATNSLLSFMSNHANSGFYKDENVSKTDYEDFWLYKMKNDAHQSQLPYSFTQNDASHGDQHIFDSYENVYKKSQADSDYISSTYGNSMSSLYSESVNFNNDASRTSTTTNNPSDVVTTNKDQFSSILNKNPTQKNSFMMSLWTENSTNSGHTFPHDYSTSQGIINQSSSNSSGSVVNSANVSNYIFQNPDYLNPLWTQFSMGFNHQRNEANTTSVVDQNSSENFDPSHAYSTDQHQNSTSGYNNFPLLDSFGNQSIANNAILNNNNSAYNQPMLNSEINSIFNKDNRCLTTTSNKLSEPTTIA